MARVSVIFVTAVALCTKQCAGAAVAEAHSLRGHHHGHHHVHHVLSHAQLPSLDDVKALPAKAADSLPEGTAPLYDDFLDIMNNAADKALQEQRAIPAYDDFLHLLKGRAEQAQEAIYQEQVATPSFDDFMTALKGSRAEASKDPVPSYEDFLTVLKVGAGRAMQQRVSREVKGDANPLEKLTNGIDNALNNNDDKIVQKANPLDQFRKDTEDGAEKTRRQVQGKPAEKEEDAMRREIRELQEKAKKNPIGGRLKKPVMDRINILRTQLCWKRPNLWEHEKCLRFLGIHCMQESTGEGICRQFAKQAGEKCKDPDANPKFKEDYCALSEALEDSNETEEEAIKEESEEEAITEDNSQGDHILDENAVGSDQDLDNELDKTDKDLEHEEGSEAVTEQAKGEDLVEEEETIAEENLLADTDGDGTPDNKDKFPNDPKEWADTDGDGIGDNSDDDIDGDGHKNADDRFPMDSKEWADTDNDGIGDNADKDRDNDGVEDDKDTFPDDPTEWKDSDKDGVGDNKDAHPYNPNCHKPGPCEDISENGSPKAGSSADPTTLDMDTKRPLPDQGYSEHMNGAPVNHENYYSWVGDWQDEFPSMDASEKDTMASICKIHPENTWCKKFKNHDSHFR